MASVLWLDFDSVAIASPLTPQFVAEFRAREPEDSARSPEEQLIAAVDRCGQTDDELLHFATRRAEPADGLIELWDWAHWNGWQLAVGGVTFDLLLDPVLDGVGLDRAMRHCGRTEMLYRRRVRFLSPRGVEIRSNFVAAYLGAYRSAGDLVVYVGNDPHGAHDARLAHATIAGPKLNEAIARQPGELRGWESLTEVVAHLDREASQWQTSFSSTTAAEG